MIEIKRGEYSHIKKCNSLQRYVSNSATSQDGQMLRSVSVKKDTWQVMQVSQRINVKKCNSQDQESMVSHGAVKKDIWKEVYQEGHMSKKWNCKKWHTLRSVTIKKDAKKA